MSRRTLPVQWAAGWVKSTEADTARSYELANARKPDWGYNPLYARLRRCIEVGTPAYSGTIAEISALKHERARQENGDVLELLLRYFGGKPIETRRFGKREVPIHRRLSITMNSPCVFLPEGKPTILMLQPWKDRRASNEMNFVLSTVRHGLLNVDPDLTDLTILLLELGRPQKDSKRQLIELRESDFELMSIEEINDRFSMLVRVLTKLGELGDSKAASYVEPSGPEDWVRPDGH